jgi:hypothetical protein
MDSAGDERFRIEGYLLREEFAAQLELGLGRIAFMHKQWAEAEKWYNDVADRYAGSASAAEAIYWAGVSQYKKSNDHTVLGRVAQRLAEKQPEAIWTEKASVWLPPAAQTKTA